MSEFPKEERKEIYQAFNDRVNLQPKELEEWLAPLRKYRGHRLAVLPHELGARPAEGLTPVT